MPVITLNKIPIDMQAVTIYLLIAGAVFTVLMVLSALILLAYLAQLLLLSIGEVIHTFNTLDPIVRCLLLLLTFSLVTFWCMRKRR